MTIDILCKEGRQLQSSLKANAAHIRLINTQIVYLALQPDAAPGSLLRTALDFRLAAANDDFASARQDLLELTRPLE